MLLNKTRPTAMAGRGLKRVTRDLFLEVVCMRGIISGFGGLAPIGWIGTFCVCQRPCSSAKGMGEADCCVPMLPDGLDSIYNGSGSNKWNEVYEFLGKTGHKF